VSVFAGALTLNVEVPLTPFSEAAIVVDPAVTPVAKPTEFTETTAVLAAIQDTVEFTFAVEPSL
jgi:hypothetical protein